MKKICVITASRSEYGLLRWIMQEITDSERFELLLIVTGSHLSPEYGLTYQEIVKDGFEISDTVETLVSSSTTVGSAKTMGLTLLGIADSFKRLDPDTIIVLGDRYELLPICSAALVMNIPIIHISGGDITEGAIDNEIRNAVSQLAKYHFPGTIESAKQLVSMGIPEERIFQVGEPGLDNFKRLKLMTREEVASSCSLDMKMKWILLTYHPETKQTEAYNKKIIKNLVGELLNIESCQIVATYANQDAGGHSINSYLQKAAGKYPEKLKLFQSLGQVRYLSIMRECSLMIGNSSSGIVEAPLLGVPVVNIGNRQKGRYLCRNVITVDDAVENIRKGLEEILRNGSKRHQADVYYGDGGTAEKILKVLTAILGTK